MIDRMDNIVESVARSDKKDVDQTTSADQPTTSTTVNASGHEQELERIFNPISLYGYAVTTGNTWITLGGSIVCHCNECKGPVTDCI